MGSFTRTKFFFPIYLVDKRGKPLKFLGNSFPIIPDGGMLTCRHVIDIKKKKGEYLAIHDIEKEKLIEIRKTVADPKSDIAFIPSALSRTKPEFIPLLSSSEIMYGEDIYTFGYYAVGRDVDDLNKGYFGGKLVSIREHKDGEPILSLQYPVLEGMSGAPVLTYHNGVKVVGMCIGNISQRVVAHEVVEYATKGSKTRETIHRIVELGAAYHALAIEKFLIKHSIKGYVITTDSFDIESGQPPTTFAR